MTIYKVFFSCFLLFLSFISFTQIPKVNAGKILRINTLKSAKIDARPIDVWIPETNQSIENLLIMHDGQNVFDSTLTWNHESWQMAKTSQKLIDEGKISPFMIAAIHNNAGKRHDEYFPQEVLNSLPEKFRDSIVEKVYRPNGNKLFFGKPQSDEYLYFIVNELIPYLKAKYPNIRCVYLAGASMGGLISAYAVMKYPHVFSGAACLSTHWIGIPSANNVIPPAFYRFWEENIAQLKSQKLFMATGNQQLDSLYIPYHHQIAQITRKKGFNTDQIYFKLYDGASHTEADWKNQVADFLQFLIGKY